jgi:hypothetical protein
MQAVPAGDSLPEAFETMLQNRLVLQCVVLALQEFAVLVYGLLSTLLPNRLPRARFAVAQYLAIAVVLVMVGSCCGGAKEAASDACRHLNNILPKTREL